MRKQERYDKIIEWFSKNVPVAETVRGFAAIIGGDMDKYPEAAFYNVGTIDDVIKKAGTMDV